MTRATFLWHYMTATALFWCFCWHYAKTKKKPVRCVNIKRTVEEIIH